MITSKQLAKREIFYNHIKNFVKEDPGAAAFINKYVEEGILSALHSETRRANDMETVLAIVIERMKGKNDLVLSLLEKHKDKSSVKWDSVIHELTR